MGGGGANAYLEALGPDTPRSLVLHLEQHLRALLRDVLCGYLDSDLKAAADDVLLTSNEPLEIRAADLRQERPQAAAPPPPPPPPPELEPEPEPEAESEPALAREKHAVEAGVTESADWDWDEDPDSYSAPV
jgi:hypothetical protein